MPTIEYYSDYNCVNIPNFGLCFSVSIIVVGDSLIALPLVLPDVGTTEAAAASDLYLVSASNRE